MREHLPYVMPIVFSTTMNNMNWSIGLEVTLSVLGFTDINTPTIGGMIYWANQHTAMVAGIWWWIAFPVAVVVMAFVGLFLLAVSMNEYIDPRSRLSRMGGRGMSAVRHGPVRRDRDARRGCLRCSRCRDLKALFPHPLFRREPRRARGRRHQLRRPARTRSTASPANRARARPR